jgi:hypothetical protein
VAEQQQFAREHRIDVDLRGYPDERVALSWRDLRRLDGAHEIVHDERRRDPAAYRRC